VHIGGVGARALNALQDTDEGDGEQRYGNGQKQPYA
jgi:hypothetical protein